MAQRADGMLNKVYLTESRLNRASTEPRLHSRFVKQYSNLRMSQKVECISSRQLFIIALPIVIDV